MNTTTEIKKKLSMIAAQQDLRRVDIAKKAGLSEGVVERMLNVRSPQALRWDDLVKVINTLEIDANALLGTEDTVGENKQEMLKMINFVFPQDIPPQLKGIVQFYLQTVLEERSEQV